MRASFLIICLRNILFYHENFQLYDSTIQNKTDAIVKEPGFAACVIALDDTIRLFEWIAYHYTTLPLTSLVIALDPKTSRNSKAAINEIVEKWKEIAELSIEIWPTDPLPKYYNFTYTRELDEQHLKRQLNFTNSCTHHFKNKGSENWLLLTDTDEFVTYNFIHPNEGNISYFDPSSIFTGPTAPTQEQREADRIQALPIRQQLVKYKNKTILEWIKGQKSEMSQSYFPSESGCNRIVGLMYGTKVAEQNKQEILLTRKYQNHQKYVSDAFSKVFLDLSKIKLEHLSKVETIHNPFPYVCGKNGRYSSGQDYISSVFRISHYVGSLEAWMERGGGEGEFRGAQDIVSWEAKNIKFSPYEDQLDPSMAYWLDAFRFKVGEDGMKKLLLKPIQTQIHYVRLKQNINLSLSMRFRRLIVSVLISYLFFYLFVIHLIAHTVQMIIPTVFLRTLGIICMLCIYCFNSKKFFLLFRRRCMWKKISNFEVSSIF